MYPTPQCPANGVFIQQQVESLRRCGIKVDVLHVDVKKSKWLYPWSLVPLQQAVLNQSYDLVHAHYVFAGVVARSQFRVPLILTHHGDETFHGWQAPLCWTISRFVDKTIVVSEQIKAVIGLDTAEVIPCGVDFDVFKPLPQVQARKQLGLPSHRKLVLFAGDVSKSLKRVDLVQRAVEILQAKRVPVDLVIAHNQPYERIPLYMNACDVLMLPSEREGSPQVVKEAMACNLPVISTVVGDVPEVLGGVEGCYLCERTVDDIVSKLNLVLMKPQRTCGREATQRYELEFIAQRIIKVYESLLQRTYAD